MRLLPFTTDAQITPLRELTLDDLWREAETLGVVRVWTYTRDIADRIKGDYKVAIIGHRKNTKLEVERRNTSLHFAMADAINEAREMGLGEE